MRPKYIYTLCVCVCVSVSFNSPAYGEAETVKAFTFQFTRDHRESLWREEFLMHL